MTKLGRRDRVGDEFLGKQAQGVFVVVHLAVTNHSDVPYTFYPDDQKLLAGGKTYAADARAAAYLDDASVLYEEVNPGNTIRGVLLFDVPPAVTPEEVELHDAPFSDGVRVSLR